MSKKIRVENKKLIRSTLILAGVAITGIAHTPVAHKRAAPEVVAEYIRGSYYNPYKDNRDWERSEARKAQIWKNIEAIREQIKRQPRIKQWVQVSANTKMLMVAEDWRVATKVVDSVFNKKYVPCKEVMERRKTAII